MSEIGEGRAFLSDRSEWRPQRVDATHWLRLNRSAGVSKSRVFRVSQAEIATSRTTKTRLGTQSGEVYGFRPTPSRLFGRPPGVAKLIEGLWIASAYTVSGGYSGAMQGGLMAADAALRHDRRVTSA
jgi:phytoene dehydrogenase-like protein